MTKRERCRIVCDGNPFNTRVYIGDKDISVYVTRIEWSLGTELFSHGPKVTLELSGRDFDVELQGVIDRIGAVDIRRNPRVGGYQPVEGNPDSQPPKKP